MIIIIYLVIVMLFSHYLKRTISYIMSWIIVFFPPHDVQWRNYLGTWKEPDTMNEHDDPTLYSYTCEREKRK